MLRLSLSTVFLLAIASIGLADSVPSSLAPGYNWTAWADPGSGVTHYYALTIQNEVPHYETWEAAQAEAQAADGYLVIIDDPAENAWLTTQFASAYTRNHAGYAWHNIAWIGLSKPSKTSTGPWTWVDGTALSESNYAGTRLPRYYRWADGTSSLKQAGNHAYLHLANHPDGAYQWNANDLHENTAGSHPMGIIESNIFSPEPASFSLLALGGLAMLRRRKAM